MKTLTVQIPDSVYERVLQRAAARGWALEQEIALLLEGSPTQAEEAQLAGARKRMEELFHRVKGFRLAPAIPREELYERGSLR